METPVVIAMEVIRTFEQTTPTGLGASEHLPRSEKEQALYESAIDVVGKFLADAGKPAQS